MVIKVAYCKYVRKDGTINSITFNTETQQFFNDMPFPQPMHFDVFVEAAQSRDVTALRKTLLKNGYKEIKEGA